MLISKKIVQQISVITSELVTHGLCNHSNYPSSKEIGENTVKIYCNNKHKSIALKNNSYYSTYKELVDTNNYNLKMLDGALIQMTYEFTDNTISKHRLAFFPSPFLEEFQNNPDIYIEDEIFAEVIKKNIVPFPLRFDFDADKNSFIELNHPKSHLTLGQYKNCRIPVSAPLTPYHFIVFILRHFYHAAFIKHSEKITVFDDVFAITIEKNESSAVHVRVPMST
ncbi:MAG: DUF2290 domain-containing protein [Magnetococcus sp. DMHC-1]